MPVPIPQGATVEEVPQTAVPIPQGAEIEQPVQSAPAAAQDESDEIPETSYGEATWGAIKNLGKDTLGAIEGAAGALNPKPQDDDERQAFGIAGIGGMLAHRMVKSLGELAVQAHDIPAAIHDINQSSDPIGTYAKILQKTASEGAAQAFTAIATHGATKAVGAAAETVGASTKSAGAALEEVKAAAGDVPIGTAKVGDTALEIMKQSERGATFPPAVRKLIQRMTKPGADPLTYEEAKDFQSNISALSADERMTMKPNTKRLVGQLNQDLKESLENAADMRGKGQQFVKAMKEYHRAMQVSEFTDQAKAAALKWGLRAAGVYGLAKLFHIGDVEH